MHCPTKPEVLAALLALLPRGRAWQTHEGGPEPFRDAAFDPKAFDPLAFDTDSRPGSVLYRFWDAAAELLTFANQRLCALVAEMFCATQVETRPEWMIEFGLPDPCDPFPDLCAKVAAIGGSTCDYFQLVASRAGWSVECVDLAEFCGAYAGDGQAGCDQVGVRRVNRMQLIVHLDESPAFGGVAQVPAVAGFVQAGEPLSCDPDIEPLRCLMERVAPAHVSVAYLPQ